MQSPAGLPRRNAFASYFREDDDDYDPGAGEYSSGNEILPDGVFVPGTRLLYFVTANYTGQTDNYLLPDTTGQNYFEIDFLPGWFDDSGHWKYPSILCVNAGSDGDLMDQMLNVALEGWDPGDPLPAHPDC